MRAHPACQVDTPNSSASLAARRGNLGGILRGRPVTENTTGKACHEKHAHVKQALHLNKPVNCDDGDHPHIHKYNNGFNAM